MAEPKPKGPTREEFDSLKGQMSEMTNILSDIASKISQPQVVTAPVGTAVGSSLEGGPQKDPDLVTLPPTYRAEVDKILGQDFDCEYRLTENGAQQFSILVPKDKSNATAEQWQAFKKDKRSVDLQGKGLKGVTEWCVKVRNNLLSSNKSLVQYP